MSNANDMGNVADSGASGFQLGQTWIAIAVLAVALALFTWQAIRSYRLARRMLAGTKWPIIRAWQCVIGALAANPAHAWSKRKLYDLVRKRLEFMIFYPRPEWYWPPRDDDDLYDSVAELNARVPNRDEARAQVAKARAAARKRFAAALCEWRQSLRVNRQDKIITLQLAGELNDALSDVKLYFDTLNVFDPDPAAQIEIQTPVRIDIGLIASQHLLTGLLVRYNEKWGGIIDGFERDTREVAPLIGRTGARDPKLAQAALDFRQIQSFIYHCWLLWGPSVPICTSDCTAWHGAYTTLQYGYGDENNSIEIVGSRDYLHAAIATLTGTVDGKPSRFGKVMAIPASVLGVLQYSSIAQLGPDRVPDALWKSWRGGQDERPILRLSEKVTAEEEKRVGRVQEDYGAIQPEIAHGAEPDRSRYYSAYFWIMFVVLREERPGEWVPLHPGSETTDRSAALWKAGIPFFEHGNMADAASCAFAKQQLADKAVSGIVNLVEAWEKQAGQPIPLRFAYACAIDESNCSMDLALGALDGGTPVIDLFRARVETLSRLEGGTVSELVKRGVIDLDFHAPKPPAALNHHAACTLSRDVAAHYARLDAHEAQAETAAN